MTNGKVGILLLFFTLTLQGVLYTENSVANNHPKTSELTVVIIESRQEKIGNGETTYAASIGLSRYTTTLELMNRLGDATRANVDNRLAIILHKNITLGELAEVITIAGKSGYQADNIHIFIKTSDSWLMPLPGFKVFRFTSHPSTLNTKIDELNSE